MRAFFSLTALATGVRVSFCTTVIGLAGLVSYFLMSQEQTVYMQYTVFTVAVISVLLGAVRSGISADSMGWLNGGILAVTYIAALLLLRMLAFPGSICGQAEMTAFFLLLVAGIIGGIAGINMKYYLLSPNKNFLRE